MRVTSGFAHSYSGVNETLLPAATRGRATSGSSMHRATSQPPLENRKVFDGLFESDYGGVTSGFSLIAVCVQDLFSSPIQRFDLQVQV